MCFNHLYYLLFSFSNLNIMTLLQKAFRQEKKFLRNFFIPLFLAVVFTVSAQSEAKLVATDSSKIEDAKTSPTKAIAANVDSVQTKTAKAKIAKVAVTDSTKANMAEKNTVKAKPITDGMKAEMALADANKSKPVKKMAIGLNLGPLNAPGLDFAYQFAAHWTARIGFGYMSYGVTGYQLSVTSTKTDGTKQTTAALLDAKANMNNLNLVGEFGVGKKQRFRLLAGLAFLPTKSIEIGGQLTTNFKFNDVTITPEDIGNGILRIGYASKVSPYLGMAFGRAIPRKRVNVSFDMGAYYMGDYRVNIFIKPGLISESNVNNAPILERNLNQKFQNKVLPNFNLRLAYKLK